VGSGIAITGSLVNGVERKELSNAGVMSLILLSRTMQNDHQE